MSSSIQQGENSVPNEGHPSGAGRQAPPEEQGGGFLDRMLHDIRFALRVLRRAPGFVIVAVATLALAIGANAVVFGILNALILRPLNVPQSESLFGLEHGTDYGYQSYPNYLDLRDRNHSFTDLAAYKFSSAGFDLGKGSTRLWGFSTTGNYFDVLGLHPYLGRFFHSADEHGPNSAPFIVLTYAYWNSHLSGDRGIIGRVVRLNKQPFTVLGVAPPQFHGTLLFFSPDFFIPLVNQAQIDGDDQLHTRGNHVIFEVFGHLRPGVTPVQAAGDLNALGAYLEKSFPNEVSHASFTLVHPSLYGSFLGPPVQGFVAGLTLLVGLILLAACANLGSLFAARATDRSREIALRLALGSSRQRVLREIFTEALLISLCGAALGLAGSIFLLHRLSVWQPFPRFPINVPVSPDAKVYVVALVLALVSGVLFGLVPVRQVLKTSPYEIVKGGSAGTFGRRINLRDVLLVIQIAICAVLVTSSLVAVRGLIRSLHSNFGFQPGNAVLANTDLKMAGYDVNGTVAMQRRMIDEVQTLSGVKQVAMINYPPLGMAAFKANVFRDETTQLRQSNVALMPYSYAISPGYFDAAGTTLLAGRSFSWHDDKNAPLVVVVNRQFAQKMAGSVGNVIGQHYKLQDGKRVQVIGVVEDGRYLSLTEERTAALFLPILQSPSSQAYLLVRGTGDPQLVSSIRGKLHDLDAGLPAEIESWTSVMDGALFPSRVATVALGVLGLMGSMLSITGIFGMAAYSVSKRIRELGIRVALGAGRANVLYAALGRAIKLLLLGSAVGLFLGILTTHVLSSIVYQATPRDPLLVVGVVLMMLLLGIVATWIPAQRALSVDPLILLRED